MDHRQNQARCIQHHAGFLNAVIFKIITAHKYMSSWSASSDEIRSHGNRSAHRLAYRNVHSQFVEERLHLSATVPPVFPRYSGGSREGLRSGRHPRFLPDRCGLCQEWSCHLLLLYITGRRVNFFHLRVFIHIRTLDHAALYASHSRRCFFALAEICDVIFPS